MRPARSTPRTAQTRGERAPIYRGWSNPRYPHPNLEEAEKYGIAIAVQRTANDRWQLLENSVPTLIGDSPSNVLKKFIALQVGDSNSGAQASAPKEFKASESDELYEQGV